MTGWLPRGTPARVRWALALALVLLVVLAPTLAGAWEDANPDVSAKFEIFLATSALVLALWAVSYNLMLGYTGMVSFAHAAYYGVGAYTMIILAKRYHWPVLEALLAAPLAAALVGVVTGWIALRAVRLYFSLLTLAISQLLFAVAQQWYDVTGGDNGINGFTLPDVLNDYTAMYYVVAGVVGICLLLMFALVRSPFGAALATIRENRERARSIGIDVKRYELAIYTVASLFAGVAGGLFALSQQEAYPGLLFWTANAQPIVVTLLGGLGVFLGPAVGAFVYTGLDNALSRNFPNQFDVVLGAIVLAVVLAFPGGFASVADLLGRLRWGRPAAGAPPEPASAGIDVAGVERAAAIRPEMVHAARGEPLLVVEGLSKAFGGLRANTDVNLTVMAGDRHAIIGPNGAGKSTLFNLVTGRLRPDAGRVMFDGRDITGRAPHQIARAGIGRAFQITMIFPRLSVLQNLQYAMLARSGATRLPFGIADRMNREEALELLRAVGLAAAADEPAGQLSHGDQRAIELAISLALGSKLILLDEPTAGMSPYETRKAMELVRGVADERGLTLLFCEHDMDVVFGTARTVTVMHMGRVLAEGTPDQVRADPEVQRVYLGELEEAAGA